MEESLRRTLVALAGHDLAVRTSLASSGALFDGYHPEMRAVHERNAAVLAKILPEYGWPTPALVGDDGANAAWLVAQHAISLPAFQRACLAALQSGAARGEVPARHPAFLQDRVRTFEGRLQVFGTQFDWDEAGQMSPLPIEDTEHVDERRADVGLSPLADAVAEIRARIRAEGREQPPADRERRAREAAAWAREVGWR